MLVLIIEDEPRIRDVITAYVMKEGWEVDYTSNGYTALELFDEKGHDFVILDLMLEGLAGEEVCKQIREKSSVPIIMLTSKTQEQDTIFGLTIGADDYICKPFRVKELIARMRALMRRVSVKETNSEGPLSFNQGHLKVDLVTHEVRKEGKLVSLTNTEYKLLTLMLHVPGKIFSRNDILYHVTGQRYLGDSRVIDTHVKNLRKKIEPDPHHHIYILTCVGAGYKFSMQSDENMQ